jgi:hypothetical protein
MTKRYHFLLLIFWERSRSLLIMMLVILSMHHLPISDFGVMGRFCEQFSASHFKINPRFTSRAIEKCQFIQKARKAYQVLSSSLSFSISHLLLYKIQRFYSQKILHHIQSTEKIKAAVDFSSPPVCSTWTISDQLRSYGSLWCGTMVLPLR